MQEYPGATWKVSLFGVILVRIFQHSDWIRRDTSCLSIFSPIGGKCGPGKLRIWTLFTQCGQCGIVDVLVVVVRKNIAAKMFLKIKLKTSSTLESIDPMAAQLKMYIK